MSSFHLAAVYGGRSNEVLGFIERVIERQKSNATDIIHYGHHRFRDFYPLSSENRSVSRILSIRGQVAAVVCNTGSGQLYMSPGNFQGTSQQISGKCGLYVAGMFQRHR